MILSTNSPYNLVSYEKEKVNEIYPQFLRDSAKNIIAFLEEYYDYLNQSGFASYELGHLTSQNDIDETSGKYLDAIQAEIAKNVPNSEVIDRNTLYKRIVHFYRLKGTPTSIEKFFALFFDATAEVYLPSKDLFKASEGEFVVPNRNWISNGLFYFQNGLTTPVGGIPNGGINIRPKLQPTFGDNFEIKLTALLSSSQPSYLESYDLNTYLFKNVVNNEESDIEIFDFVRDYSTNKNYINIRQTSRLNADWENVRLYLDRDIFDDKWHNIVIKYSANNDGITLTPNGIDKIIIEGAKNLSVNGTYKYDSGDWKKITLDSPETLSNSGLYNDVINSATTFDASTLIDGEEYEIAVIGTINWTSIGATTGTQGEVFTYNGVTITGSDGEVYHRTAQWHYRIYDDNSPSSYEIYFRDGLYKTYHISGGQPGGIVADNENISKILFIQENTLTTQQTATVKVLIDDDIALNQKIPNNGGFSEAADIFSILNYDYDTFSLIAHIEVNGSIENGFEYRFNEYDRNIFNKLTDYSNNNNDGIIYYNNIPASSIISTNFYIEWDTNVGGSVGGNYLLAGDIGTENEYYYTEATNHRCEILITDNEYRWKISSGIDPDIFYISGQSFPSYNKLPRPWYIKNWSPLLPEGVYIEPQFSIEENEFLLWEDELYTWSPIPSKIQPLPLETYYTNRDGHLSDVKKIQDSNFWQDYSYQIITSIPSDKWQDSFNRLVHPAGMRFFALLLVEVISRGVWDEYISYLGTSQDLDSWLFALVPPNRRPFTNNTASHTPKYQPGWLQSLQKSIINLIAEYDLSNNIQDEIKQFIIAKQYFILGDEYSQYYVSNYYQDGSDGIGPQFWYDERPLNESGYLEFKISDISDKINPYSSIIEIS